MVMMSRGSITLLVCLTLLACRDEQAGPRPPPLDPQVATSPGGSGDEIPRYAVRRVAEGPRLDGVLEDVAWRSASPVELVQSFDGRRTVRRTVARLVRDDQALYVAFDCEDPDVWGTYLKRDDPLYGEEVVEIFLDADGDGRTYQELEVSPRNVLFDAYFPARREGMELGYDAQASSAVQVRGTLDDRADRDRGWSVELRIPFAALSHVPRSPPGAGDRWRFNLYRLEQLAPGHIEGQAFSPLGVRDFHHLPRFGWLDFVD